MRSLPPLVCGLLTALIASAACRGDDPNPAETPITGTPEAGPPAAGTPEAGTPAAGAPAAGTPAAGTHDTGAAPAANTRPEGVRHADGYAAAAAIAAPICDHLWSADLIGDGGEELICTRETVLTVLGAAADGYRPRLEVTGAGLPNAGWAGDLDGDARDEFVIAFGMGRGHAAAPVQVLELDAEPGGGAWWVRRWLERRATRPQVTALWGPPLYIAYFADKYTVRAGFLRADGTLRDPRDVTMGMEQLWADVDGDGDDELVVGRMYGDEPRSDGDLAVFDGDRRLIVPTVRGVRALHAADLDGDGRDELLFGDGWHYRYRDDGEGRLNVARLGDDGVFTSALIHELPGEYAVMRIDAADLDGDGRMELLASGNDQLYRYDGDGERWNARSLGAAGVGGGFTLHTVADGTTKLVLPGDPVRWLDP